MTHETLIVAGATTVVYACTRRLLIAVSRLLHVLPSCCSDGRAVNPRSIRLLAHDREGWLVTTVAAGTLVLNRSVGRLNPGIQRRSVPSLWGCHNIAPPPPPTHPLRVLCTIYFVFADQLRVVGMRIDTTACFFFFFAFYADCFVFCIYDPVIGYSQAFRQRTV